MIALAIFVAAISFYILSIQLWRRQTKAYFAKRNVKFIESRIIKGLLDLILRRISIFEAVKAQYDEFPDEQIVGFYGTEPHFSLRSPEVIKKVVVKDFEFFQDHRQVFDVKNEPLLGNSLISLSGEKWHRMRATLSPAFTGSKMRQMFELVTEYTDEAAKLLTQKSAAEKLDLEMKDFFSRFTNDIIATCAFGLKVSSIAEPNNDFFRKAQGMSPNRSLLHSMKLIFIAVAPKLASALKIKFFDGEPSKTFESIILDTMNVRREQNIHRPDMINLLLQVRDGTLTHPANDEKKCDGFAAVEVSEIGKRPTDRNWSDVELVAQCFLFFLAGFETVSAALAFASYEIMANPEVQQTLYDEIKEASDRLNGKRISYDALQKLKYLDQFISEVLRKWPPAFQVERMCVKDYQYEDGHRTFTIEKGQSVFIPIYGLHQDERYFPQPKKFDPERFSDENKSKIVPGSYLPFGVGPRNCIGSRFALMEVKAVLFYLLVNFSFERNIKTSVPIQMQAVPRFGIKHGLHMELRPRH